MVLTALFTIHCSLFTSHAMAQRFFNLTADEVRIDTLLPVFNYAYPLGSHYADSTYTVTIEYPEFVPMSCEETERYKTISNEQWVSCFAYRRNGYILITLRFCFSGSLKPI